MKRKIFFGAALIAPLFLLTACAAAPSLTITANWYANTSNDAIVSGTHETLRYDVTFAPSKAESEVTVSYTAGSYTTDLSNLTVTAENSVEGLPIGFTGYLLHTETSLTGSIAYRGSAGEVFQDTILTDVWFSNAADGLRPMKSVQTVDVHIPNTAATSKADAAMHNTYTSVIVYNANLSKATHTLTVGTAAPVQKTIGLGSGGSFFDNAEILFALRGLDLSSTFSFRTINSAKAALATVASLTAPADTKYETPFSMGGESVTSVDAVQIQFGYTGDNSGQSQTAVYALCTNQEENLYRNALLRLDTPALYGLGTFTYTLAEATFAAK